MRCPTFLFVALPALFPSLLSAQEPPMKYGKVPKEDLEMKVYSLDTSAPAVVLCDYGKVTFEFPDDGDRCVLNRHKRIKILRRAGFEYGDIVIPYYSQGTKITTLKAQVIAPDGKETEVAKKDIFDEKVSERWSHIRFAFPNLREGCVVEYRYEYESKFIFELPEWYFQADIPVRWSELRLEIPVWYNYVSLTQGRPLDVAETVRGRGSVLVSRQFSGALTGTVDFNYTQLVMKNAPAIKEEAFITTMDDYYARMRFQLKSTQFNEAPPEPVMGTWGKVATELLERGDFGAQFTKKNKYKKVWEAAAPMVAAQATPDEKIQAAYKFVQSTFKRDEGYGILARQNLDELFEKKTATAYEMNLLLVALLREAGLQAHPVLISTRDHGQPVPQYPIMDQFNHVLAFAEVGDKSLLLDAGNPFRPPGLVAVNSLNRQGFLVHPTNPQWVQINPFTASETWLGVLQLDEEGNLRGRMQTAAEGYSAMSRRDDYSQKPVADFWKTTLQEHYPEASVDSVTVENKDDMNKPLSEKFVVELPNYAQVSGNLMYLNPVYYSSYHENPFKLEHRSYPVDIPFPIKERVVLDLAIPPGYVVESLPESARYTLPNNGGRFQYNIGQKDGKISLNCTLNITQLFFSPEEYENLRSFFGMAAEKMGEQVVLKKG